MATTINKLLEMSGLDTTRLHTIKWGTILDNSSAGIYIVSTSPNSDLNSNLFNQAPIDNNKLRFWTNKVPTIKVDGSTTTVKSLRQRLSSFWLPDENIIYIGQTKSKKGLGGRVRQFYDTELGDKKPHAGGHWIKTLKNLKQLFVHYIPTINPGQMEENLLREFVSQVSSTTLENLHDKLLPLPFANLELEKGNRKNHGITRSKLGD